MSKRKFDISQLTDAQLEEIATLYPKAVRTVRKPVYKQIAMLLECGLPVPGMASPPKQGDMRPAINLGNPHAMGMIPGSDLQAFLGREK